MPAYNRSHFLGFQTETRFIGSFREFNSVLNLIYLQHINKRVKTTDSKSLPPSILLYLKKHPLPHISLDFENFTPPLHSKHCPSLAINNEKSLIMKPKNPISQSMIVTDCYWSVDDQSMITCLTPHIAIDCHRSPLIIVDCCLLAS